MAAAAALGLRRCGGRASVPLLGLPLLSAALGLPGKQGPRGCPAGAPSPPARARQGCLLVAPVAEVGMVPLRFLRKREEERADVWLVGGGASSECRVLRFGHNSAVRCCRLGAKWQESRAGGRELGVFADS